MSTRLIAFIGVVLFVSSAAFALEGTTSRSKYGFNVNGVATADANKGWVVDAQYVHYLAGSAMTWGIEAGYGMPIPTSGNALIFGGAIVGVENMTKWGILMGATVSVDAAQATQYGLIVGPPVVALVKPQVWLGFSLGGGFRLAFNAGYLEVSNVQAFCGPIFGARIDFKMETSTKPVDD